MRTVPALLLLALLSATGMARAAAPSERPRIVVDRIDLPSDLPRAEYTRLLSRILLREAKAQDWGASAASTIAFRFTLVRLDVIQQRDTLRVECEAKGVLPRSRPARSQLAYGGSPKQRQALVRQVLTIVARGVVTRLAELERTRRGKQSSRQVRLPDLAPEG